SRLSTRPGPKRFGGASARFRGAPQAKRDLVGEPAIALGHAKSRLPHLEPALAGQAQNGLSPRTPIPGRLEVPPFDPAGEPEAQECGFHESAIGHVFFFLDPRPPGRHAGRVLIGIAMVLPALLLPERHRARTQSES